MDHINHWLYQAQKKKLAQELSTLFTDLYSTTKHKDISATKILEDIRIYLTNFFRTQTQLTKYFLDGVIEYKAFVNANTNGEFVSSVIIEFI